MSNIFCEYCGNRISGWHYKYKGMVFCEDNNSACIKNYLFEEHDKEIEEDKEFDDYYDMDYVTFMEERGFG